VVDTFTNKACLDYRALFWAPEESTKYIFYKKTRITSPKTTYRAVCVQWHPRN